MNNSNARMIAGIMGLSGVALGAFGAHMLQDLFGKLGTERFWQTGTTYHLVHAVVLLIISGWKPLPRLAYYLIFAGIILFSGSLYALALTYAKWIGAITPLGGLAFLFGWLALAFSLKNEKPPDRHS
jgi:uncharacterized membrane protein YgdD (TMEM256/DUF423 family)